MRRALIAAAALAALGAGGLGAWRWQDRQARFEAAAEATGGDPARGPAAMGDHGCGGCHEIPGVAGADGRVGPPLTGWSQRVYLAGRMTNTPANLVAWLRAPQRLDPGTAMPDMGVSEAEARDMAAYLYTVR